MQQQGPRDEFSSYTPVPEEYFGADLLPDPVFPSPHDRAETLQGTTETPPKPVIQLSVAQQVLLAVIIVVIVCVVVFAFF